MERPRVDVPALSVADFAFVALLDKTDFGETWQVKIAAGKAYICQFVPPNDPEKTAKLLAHLCVYRHAGSGALARTSRGCDTPRIVRGPRGPDARGPLS